MNKKIAELTVRKSSDYYDKVAKVLEDAGFVLVLDIENTSDIYYTVAENEEDKCKADMRKPVGEKIRCNTCKNNDDELSGECYECIKGIFDHYEAESEDK